MGSIVTHWNTDKFKDGERDQIRKLINGVNLVIGVAGSPGATDSPYFDDLGEEIRIVFTEKTARRIYQVGTGYTILPSLRGTATCSVRIARISRQDVRHITETQAGREGFNSIADFLTRWVSQHDGGFAFYENVQGEYQQWCGRGIGWKKHNAWEDVMAVLERRPAKLYDAWVLDVEVV